MAYDWSTAEAALADLVDTYTYADDRWYWADWHYISGRMWFDGANYVNALGDALEATRQLGYCVKALIRKDVTYSPNYLLPYYLTNYAGITWESIVEAWVKDDFKGRFWTIGVIDRMRQIMWDEPFDITWAARPEETEIES